MKFKFVDEDLLAILKDEGKNPVRKVWKMFFDGASNIMGHGTEMAIEKKIGTLEVYKDLALFVGNVRGDKPVGRELLLILANWICDNYLRDPSVKLIVKNVHLHILPSMNPDGFSLRSRGNANGIDLNRDFPDQARFALLFSFLMAKIVIIGASLQSRSEDLLLVIIIVNAKEYEGLYYLKDPQQVNKQALALSGESVSISKELCYGTID
ncbi:carboxypeptidase D-like [Durio zibethinus]|uniref:Carboxypeptidase D-like n=1 Tax=Durio zibethinus TaxID=66656 RepID=A0A6P6AM36_DURZI|nr:carboxypeptidase D-like [Durio zibethinus]